MDDSAETMREIVMKLITMTLTGPLRLLVSRQLIR